MKTGIGAIALGMGLVALPARALTPQERVNLGMGLQVAGCLLAANCGGYAPRYVPPGFGIPAGVSPGFGVIPHHGIVVAPGFGVIPYSRRVWYPGFGAMPGAGPFPVVVPRRLYDARVEIDQIYREVLGRPADLDGLRTYQARFDEGWSLGQIRNDIANSAEARSRW